MTENSGSNPVLGKIFDLANTWAVPFVQQIAKTPTGKNSTQTLNQDRLQEIAEHSRLNGSGPSDPAMALDSAPNSLQGFISGGMNSAAGQVAKVPQGLLLFAILGMLLFFMVKHSRS